MRGPLSEPSEGVAGDGVLAGLDLARLTIGIARALGGVDEQVRRGDVER